MGTSGTGVYVPCTVYACMRVLYACAWYSYVPLVCMHACMCVYFRCVCVRVWSCDCLSCVVVLACLYEANDCMILSVV